MLAEARPASPVIKDTISDCFRLTPKTTRRARSQNPYQRNFSTPYSLKPSVRLAEMCQGFVFLGPPFVRADPDGFGLGRRAPGVCQRPPPRRHRAGNPLKLSGKSKIPYVGNFEQGNIAGSSGRPCSKILRLGNCEQLSPLCAIRGPQTPL